MPLVNDVLREREERERAEKDRKTAIALRIIKWSVGGLIAFITIVICWPFNSVPTGSRGVVTQFGRIIGIEPEGLVTLPPWQNLYIFSIRSEVANIENAQGATSDIQPVTVSLTVRYGINTDKVSEVFEKYSHNGDLSSYVQTATMETFKAVTATYDAPALITQRAKVSADVNSMLASKLSVYGAHVISIDMRNFEFTAQYWAATNQKTVQEQLKLAADNKFKTVESEQKQKVAIAEAEAAAVRAKADGDSYALLKNATAQAESLKVQNAALAQNKDVLELRRIEVQMKQAEAWDGKLPENMYGSAPLPFLQLGH